MRDGPSRTAHRVALRRAAHQILDTPRVFDDPLALAILEPETAAALAADPARFASGALSSRLRAFMAVRSRYAEDALAVAVARGVECYVVLGAGLDTFAYRNPHPGLRVFEVDHPATQQWKRERLAAAGISIPSSLQFVPVDFERQGLGEELARVGLAAGTAAFFAWLGVTPYLTRTAVTGTLRVVAGCAPGSAIVFDYALERSTLSLFERSVYDALAVRVARAGEPWLSGFVPAELVAMLRGIGFSEAEDVTPETLNTRYFRERADGLAIGTLAHLMHARV